MKECPKCSGPLARMSSLNLLICVDCRTEYDWLLKPNQPPLVDNNRSGRRKK